MPNPLFSQKGSPSAILHSTRKPRSPCKRLFPSSASAHPPLIAGPVSVVKRAACELAAAHAAQSVGASQSEVAGTLAPHTRLRRQRRPADAADSEALLDDPLRLHANGGQGCRDRRAHHHLRVVLLGPQDAPLLAAHLGGTRRRNDPTPCCPLFWPVSQTSTCASLPRPSYSHQRSPTCENLNSAATHTRADHVCIGLLIEPSTVRRLKGETIDDGSFTMLFCPIRTIDYIVVTIGTSVHRMGPRMKQPEMWAPHNRLSARMPRYTTHWGTQNMTK